MTNKILIQKPNESNELTPEEKALEIIKNPIRKEIYRSYFQKVES